MATLKQIRGRIKAAKNIQQITKAMKLVAAARLKKATDRVLEARPYADKMRELMGSISSAGELPSHPLLEKRPVQAVGLILVTADRGLAGGYNTNLIRKGVEFVRNSTVPVKVIGVGKKGHGFLAKRGTDVVFTHTVSSAGATVADADIVAARARKMYESGEVDAVYVLYSKFFSAIRQVPQVTQLLPIEPPPATATAGNEAEYEFEPSAAGLLDVLLPRYFKTLVTQAMLEATASEFGARMTAMTAATDNAGKMIGDLTLQANRERQTAITTQILEIVGGANALEN